MSEKRSMRFLSAGEDGEPIPPPEPEPIDEEAVSRCLLFLPQQQQQQQLALAASATKPHSWHSLPRQLSFFSSVFLPLSADRAHILSFSFVFVRFRSFSLVRFRSFASDQGRVRGEDQGRGRGADRGPRRCGRDLRGARHRDAVRFGGGGRRAWSRYRALRR